MSCVARAWLPLLINLASFSHIGRAAFGPPCSERTLTLVTVSAGGLGADVCSPQHRDARACFRACGELFHRIDQPTSAGAGLRAARRMCGAGHRAIADGGRPERRAE